MIFKFKIVAACFLGLMSIAHAGDSKVNTDATAVIRDTWTPLYDALPKDGRLLEGSYLGEGKRTRAEYRLHLRQYLDRSDTFVAVMESEALDLAVIGYVIKNESNGTYLWKEISVGSDLEQIEPRPSKNPMYRLRPQFDQKGLPKNIELIGSTPEAGAEIVLFNEARATLMRTEPVKGDYSKLESDDRSTWDIRIFPTNGRDSAVWSLEQVWSTPGSNGSGTETDLARFDLPGVMAVREAVYKGYVAHPSAAVKWALVAIDRTRGGFFSESHIEGLLIFKVTPAGDEHVLVRPSMGHRLYFVEPK